MKNRLVFSIILLISLTTFISQKDLQYEKLKIKEIRIENNFIVEEKQLKKELSIIYNQNILLLKPNQVSKILNKNNFIDSFTIKKKYPNILLIKIFEKKPIAIIQNKKNKFYVSDKIELIKSKDMAKFNNLPIIFGDKKNFKKLYFDLKKINFPLEIIKNYYLFESTRWDLETYNGKVIKLSNKNYITNLKNFLEIQSQSNFEKYKIFDYRIKNQLILK